MPRIYLQKMNMATAKLVREWTDFNDPRLIGYNYAKLSDFEIKLWYGSITTPRRKYFAVKKLDDDRFIGFIGLKQINPITRRAKLGIVFDSAYVSMGYGTEAIKLLLDKAFSDYKLREVSLEVNLFNERAYRAYRKCGFRQVDSSTEVFENQNIDMDERYFVDKSGLIYSKILTMMITKDDYYGL
ncbi:GNAT family N-acetyltransferase [Anaerococcus tetradius]|uniref:GNAT family N-acetyltransferase n=1 Tax=Anaerococcus tetradius TaxID=33036 RepID=UPI0023F03B00|nr:GNAT family N-acetyltransferase [Anaerococcus tetradius]